MLLDKLKENKENEHILIIEYEQFMLKMGPLTVHNAIKYGSLGVPLTTGDYVIIHPLAAGSSGMK